MKIPPKSRRSSVFWISLGVFCSFLEYFNYFLGFNGIFVILKVFGVVVVVFGGDLVIVRVLGYFGHSWCIFVILTILGGRF